MNFERLFKDKNPFFLLENMLINKYNNITSKNDN